MKAKRYFTPETILRAAEKIKNTKLQDLKIKNPDLINSISEQQIREAFIKASKRLDALTRQRI